MKSKLFLLAATLLSFSQVQAGSFAAEADRVTHARDVVRALPKGVLVRIDAKGNRVVVPTSKLIQEGADLSSVARSVDSSTKLAIKNAPRVTEFDKARPKQAWYSYYTGNSYSFQNSHYWYYNQGYSYGYQPYWQTNWNNYNWQYYSYQNSYQGCGYWWYPSNCYSNGWGHCGW